MWPLIGTIPKFLKQNRVIIFISPEKKKDTPNWFIGAITDENNRAADLPLSFLDKGKKYLATIYRDAPNADWKDNPEAYTIEQFIVDNKTKLRIELAKGGGAAVSIFPATEAESKK